MLILSAPPLQEKGGAASAIARKRRAELPPRYRAFSVGLPAPQTDRHRMAGRWRTPSLKGATCRRSNRTSARRVPGVGGAWCLGPRASAEKSGARVVGSCRVINAVAEGSGARGAGSCRRHSAVKLCHRRPRSPGAPRRHRCGCVAASAEYTGRRAEWKPSRRGSGRGRSALNWTSLEHQHPVKLMSFPKAVLAVDARGVP